MIELQKEKFFSSKDPKFQSQKPTILFDKFRIQKFSSCTTISIDTRLIIYIGFSTGEIYSITIFKQKHLYKKYEDITLYKSLEKDQHKGPVNTMICKKIDNIPILFSGGYDGTIKIWQGDPELREKDMVHLIKTLYEHKSTVVNLAFCKSRNLLISTSSDMTLKIFKLKDKDDKIFNPKFECLSVFKDFHFVFNKEKDLPFWISSLSLKETDVIELFAGDTKGRVLIYHYIDDNYFKYRGEKSFNKEYSKNNFNYMFCTNLHRKWGIIKIVHSIFDNIIYSVGYDNNIVCYNTKNKLKTFEISNSNSKTHFSSLTINTSTQELIVGDDVGNITFIKIFNKSEFKIKAINNKIFHIENVNIFPEQEYLLIVCEDNINLFKVNRKAKVSNVQHHDSELIKLFVVEPIKIEEKIIEDAKVISSAYDNIIKIWDFLTMDCINLITGPELSKKNIEVSTICYLNDSLLIAIGTDMGNIFFWDLNRSEYLKNSYEKYFRHKNIVTNMISYIIKNKDNYKECMISCSIDGFIFIWEVQKTEIKEIKKKNEYNYSDNLIFKNNKGLNDLEKLIPKDNKYHPEMKNYKCIPGIKQVINTLSLTKQELKFNVVGYQPENPYKTIFSGVNDYYIYLWDYTKGNYKDKIKGNNSSVNCISFDKNFLITSGIDGYIDIWNIPKDSNNNIDLIITLNDPDINSNGLNVRIHDILILSDIGVLVTCSNMKKINFWKYEKEELILTIKRDNEVTCLACVQSYGKLLCGTKEKMIFEIDLAEQLDSIGFPHNYEKYSFLKNEINFIENDTDKGIDNFKIMKSLTQGI
jgi:WD40 repeat protein